MLIKKIGLIAAIVAALAAPAMGQALSTGKVTTAAPTYVTGTAGALSLDTSGNLRVVSGGAPTGTTDVNIVEVGGNAVTTTVPISGTVSTGGLTDTQLRATPVTVISPVVTTTGALDVTCVAGCVAGVGTANGQATTAAPSYVNATPNPLSLDLSGNLRTIIGNASIPVTGTFWQATQPVSGTVAATQSGTWNVTVNAALPAGNNNIGDVDVASLPALPTGSNNIGSIIPATTGLGLSNYSLIAANSTNATNVKNGAGSLYELSVYNSGSTIAYLKLYDSGSAPTCGSGTPVARYLIPGAATGGAGSNVNINVGKSFASGIAFCLTTGIADADTGAVAATTYLVNLTYK